jgi:hypothetical protein
MTTKNRWATLWCYVARRVTNGRHKYVDGLCVRCKPPKRVQSPKRTKVAT